MDTPPPRLVFLDPLLLVLQVLARLPPVRATVLDMALIDADDAVLVPSTRTKKPKRPGSVAPAAAVVFGSTPISDAVRNAGHAID